MPRLSVYALFAAGVVLALPASLQAGEELEYGPAPDWVVEIAPGPAQQDGEDLPYRTLLFDYQVKLTPQASSSYSHNVFEIRNAQGLASGNLAVVWSPEHDRPTVHKVLIRRGEEVIDVLAEGQEFSILRREQNLEQSMLNGLLTAHILPEGLQVGDIVEFATSVESSNPVLGGHVETSAGLNFPSEKSHLRIEWPSSVALRLAQSDNLPAMTVTKRGKSTVAELTLEDVEAVLPPRLAPLRHALFGFVEVSDFTSWAELAQHFAPLYGDAAAVPAQGSLRDEVERIRALSEDPVIRAEAALRLVQDEVRYVALLMGASALVPADAETTWARRFGDCKAKTALLLAILEEFGIDAVPVFVSITGGDLIRDRLPAVGLFNHVLVRARIDGREYWLDGTRMGDRKLANLPVPDLGWVLPLTGGSSELVRLTPPPLERPEEDLAIHFDTSAGLSLPAPAKVEMVLRGDMAIGTNAALMGMSTSARDRALREYWRARLRFVEIGSTGMAYDADAAELRLTMTGEAEMDWDGGWYETDWTGVGFAADFDRAPGPNSDAPYLIPHPYFERTRQTIVLPPGFTADAIRGQAEIDQVVSGVEYKRRAGLEGNVFTIERTKRSLQPEFPATEARSAQRELRRLHQETIHLRRPDTYRQTAAEMDLLLSRTPETAAQYIDRGYSMLNAGRHADALVDFEDATDLEPGNALAWANRGITLVWLQNLTEAEASFVRAERLFAEKDVSDTSRAVVYRGRGLLAEYRYDIAGAVAQYTASLEHDPGNLFAIGHRAHVNWQLRDAAAALADADEGLRLNPAWTDLYALRAHIYHALGDEPRALEQIDLLRGNGAVSESMADFVIAGIYRTLGRYDDAIALFDRVMERGPDAAVLAALATDGDRQQMITDAQAFMLGHKALIQVAAGDYAGALDSYDTIARIIPNSSDSGLLSNRGIVLWRMGREQEARELFKEVRKRADSAAELNNICYMKALSGVALELALEECNASLRKQADFPPTLDSRALAYLRLGRVDEALADFDKAIAGMPFTAAAFYGRALAWHSKGDLDRARADAKKALTLNPSIVRMFEENSLPLPPELQP